jgi:hypothetical protein
LILLGATLSSCAAAGCKTPPPAARDVALMSPRQRLALVQTQQVAQAGVATSIRQDVPFNACDAAWTLAPQY